MMEVRSVTPSPDQSFAKMLDTGLEQLACRAGVAPADLQAVQRLRDDIAAWTGAMYNSVRTTTELSETQGWGWLPFRDDASLRLGLLTIHSGQPISIHDHPGSTGLLLILEGSLQIINYACASPIKPTATRQMVSLTETGKQSLSAGDITLFDPTEGNIHAVAADRGPCVVLDILLSPYSDDERGWYMPLDDKAASRGKFTAMRLSRAPLAAHAAQPPVCAESPLSAIHQSFAN